MNLKNLFTPSIRRRITVAFLIVTVLVMAMAVVSYLQLRQVQPYSDAIIRDSAELVAYQEIAQSLSDLDANLERYLVIRGVEYQEAVGTNLQEMSAGLVFIQAGDDPTEEDPLIFEELTDTIDQLQSDVQAVLALEPDASSKEINEYIFVVYDGIEKAQQLQGELTDLTLEQLEATAQTQSQIASNVVIQSVFLGIIVVLFTIITAVTTDRRLLAINTLTNTATAIAEGDLTRVAPVERNDEIGTLATAFNSMTSQLRETLEGLESQVSSRTRALETSTAVSRRLSTILDQRDLVREVVEQVQSAFEYYHAHIYLFDNTKENLLMVGGTGEAGRTMLEQAHSVPKGRGLVGRAGDTNLPVLVPDVSQADGWLPNPLLPETRAEAAIPIAIGENVLGVLDVQDDAVGGLTEADIDLLQSIANQVAIALQNARAYQHAQQQVTREALIANISQQIQSTTDVEETLQVAVREIGRALGAKTHIKLKTTEPGNGQEGSA